MDVWLYDILNPPGRFAKTTDQVIAVRVERWPREREGPKPPVTPLGVY